jgi:glycosyltransferase involved in cell wall biosynthesis
MTPLILKTCAHFARLGYEVELWVPWRYNPGFIPEDTFVRYAMVPEFPIRRLPALDLTGLGSFGFLLMVATFNVSAYMRLLFRREHATLYAHDFRDLILPSLSGLPYFIEIHDFYESSVRFVSRSLFRRAMGLIVTNTLKIEQISRHYGIPRERMIRQPNAVEASAFDIPQTQAQARAELNLPSDQKLVLYAGHLFSWKGVHTLADSAQYLKDMHIVFVGGTESDRIEMERYVALQKLPRITFVPHQPPHKIPLYLRAADVLVLPNTAKEEASRIETSPVKLFEYLAAGKPIVASDLPSIRDIVSEREVFFAHPDDPQDFARVIEHVLAHPEEAAARAAAGKTLAGTHSWEARAKKIRYFMEV